MKPSSLAGLQTAFHSHLLDQPSDIAQQVAERGAVTVAHRLHIYHHAYRARLVETLQDVYEKTWAYLGDGAFESSALAFIEATPSRCRNLRWYGVKFPVFLAARLPQDPDIAELASIEWQLRHALDGPDARPIDAAQLAALAPEQWESVGFRFVPTLFLLPLRYNTVSIWHALDQGHSPPVAETLPDPSWLLIWRKVWQPHFRSLDAVEHAALTQLLAKSSFAEACACLNERYPAQDTATVMAGYLKEWLDGELIAGLRHLSARRLSA